MATNASTDSSGYLGKETTVSYRRYAEEVLGQDASSMFDLCNQVHLNIKSGVKWPTTTVTPQDRPTFEAEPPAETYQEEAPVLTRQWTKDGDEATMEQTESYFTDLDQYEGPYERPVPEGRPDSDNTDDPNIPVINPGITQ